MAWAWSWGRRGWEWVDASATDGWTDGWTEGWQQSMYGELAGLRGCECRPGAFSFLKSAFWCLKAAAGPYPRTSPFRSCPLRPASHPAGTLWPLPSALCPLPSAYQPKLLTTRDPRPTGSTRSNHSQQPKPNGPLSLPFFPTGPPVWLACATAACSPPHPP